MASFNRDGDLLAGLVDRMLLPADGRGWLKSGPEENITSVADAAQGTAGMIGKLLYMAILHTKGIVVGTSVHFCYIKSISQFKTFDSSDGEDRLCQIGT